MGCPACPSSSPTLSPIYDGLDVNVTSNVTWFHLNHDMVSRRIYKLCSTEGTPLQQSFVIRSGRDLKLKSWVGSNNVS